MEKNGEPVTPESLFHVMFVTKPPSSKDSDGHATVNLRVTGTYRCLPAAKAAARKVIYEAGYEKEMFELYDTKRSDIERDLGITNREGVPEPLVLARASDDTVLEVYVLTTENRLGLGASVNGDGCDCCNPIDEGKIRQNQQSQQRITRDLYHVLQTTVNYYDASGDSVVPAASQQTYNIEASFNTYAEARDYALKQALLSEDDGLTRDSYERYDEPALSETDCGFGENVLVHAVGYNGENTLISVVKEMPLESVRLAEAAMRIR